MEIVVVKKTNQAEKGNVRSGHKTKKTAVTVDTD